MGNEMAPLAMRARRLILCGLMAMGAAAWSQEVIPDFYKDPGLYPNRSYINQDTSENIDPFTGSLQHHYVDLNLPGNGGFDLKVVRSYNSASVDSLNPAAYKSLAGLGWSMHFGRVLKPRNTSVCLNTNGQTVLDNPVLELPDGSRQLLAFTGTTQVLMLSTQRWRVDCGATGVGVVAYSPQGVRYDMTQLVNEGTAVNPLYAWYATRITDRNGNYAAISYATGASPEITAVSTSDGRSISFSYADSGLASRRITSVSGAGQTYSYAYQAVAGVADQYLLTSVTRPDGRSWGYSYNGNLGESPGGHLMQSTTYPQGGSISYSYGHVYFDSQANPYSRATVVSAKSSSPGGNWTFAYAPGAPGAYDTTTVVSPAGTTIYRHVGPNYSSSGSVWMVGLLMSKSIGTLQIETYAWTKQKIGSENYLRPGAFVLKVDSGETNAPVLSQKTIVRDGASYSTTFSNFDSYGNPGTVIEAGPGGGSRTTAMTYYINTDKWIVKQPQSESFSGGSLTRTFDTSGNLSGITQDGVAMAYTYDSQGNVASATFPRGLAHSYSSYYRGIAQAESQPEGVSIARTVSDAGNVTSETNGEGRRIDYTYDTLNRITSVAYPLGSAVAVSYGANSRTATRGALTEVLTFDGFGRTTGVSLGGVARSFTVDALGRRTFESDPAATTGTSYQYDMLDRVTRIGNADGTSRKIGYGAGSMSVTDERGKVTTRALRAYGNPDQTFVMSVTAPETSANLILTRNARDQVASAMQGGFTRTYGYNSNYYLNSASNPETGITTYGRDAAGNMTSKTVGTAGTTTYTYDGQNRLVTTTPPAGNTPGVTNTYSKTHKLLTTTSSLASRAYGYDANGNLTSETLTVDGIALKAGYAYNGNDKLSTVTYPRSGYVLDYAPDALGRPTQASGYATGVTYWPSGQVRQITLANGTTSAFGQNTRLWPASFTVQRGGTAYLSSSYSYDGTGNLTAIADTVDAAYNRTLTFDGIGRLISASGPWGAGSIAYTGGGNISSQVLGASSLYYSYDTANRLASTTGVRAGSYTHDAQGNMTAGPGVTYSYDSVPNLRCVNCASATDKIEYTYDPANQRATVLKAGVKTYEMYDSRGNLLVEFVPGQSNKLTEHIYLHGRRIAQRQLDNSGTATTVLAASANPANARQSVTLTATVVGTGAGSTPTGSVTFKDGTTSLGTAALSNGRASLSVTFASAGSRALTASYSGDAYNSAATSATLQLEVRSQPSATTLAASAASVLTGQSVTFSSTVTGATPAGTVTFQDGNGTLGTATLNAAGVATFNASWSTPGARTVTASYGGDSANTASVSTGATVQVNGAGTTATTLVATPNPAFGNQPVTLVATVTGKDPVGTVSFSHAGALLGTATLTAGKATLSTSFATTGTRSLIATYNGSTGNAASTSQPVSLDVVAQATSTSVTASANPARTGTPVNLVAKVTGNAPTGSVVFKSGTAVLGTAALSAGQATLSATFAAASTQSITASYAGDALNAASESPALALSVTSAPQATQTSLSLSSTPGAMLTRNVTAVATVTGNNPTGTVTFSVNGVARGTATLVSGKATLAFNAQLLATIVATYSGDAANTASSTSAPVR